jgi:uncharacterized protein Usg
MIYRFKTLVLLDIIYYRPDCPNLVNQFVWEVEDVVPELMRVHKFLLFWKENIEAKIKEIAVCAKHNNEFRRLDEYLKL